MMKSCVTFPGVNSEYVLIRVWLLATWTVACQIPLSMEFPRQEYWSRLPFPSPGDLPNPGVEPGSPALQADSLPSESPEKTKKKPMLPQWKHLKSFCFDWTEIRKEPCQPDLSTRGIFCVSYLETLDSWDFPAKRVDFLSFKFYWKNQLKA